MRTLLSGLANRFFGIPVLCLALAIGGVARLGSEGEPEPIGRNVRAEELDDPAHQATCRMCRIERELAERHGHRWRGQRRPLTAALDPPR